MKYCSKCGASINDGMAFCPSCGGKVPIEDPAQVQHLSQSPNPPIQQPQPMYVQPVKKGKAKTIAAVAVVGVIVVVVLLIMAAMANGSNTRAGLFSSANIQIVSSTYSQSTLSGDVTCHVKVTNTGNAVGSETIRVDITEPSGVFTKSMTVSLAPGETSTYDIVVNTPFGTAVTSSMIDIYIV